MKIEIEYIETATKEGILSLLIHLSELGFSFKIIEDDT